MNAANPAVAVTQEPSVGPEARGAERRGVATALDTFPKLLLRNAAERGTRPAIREKDLGIWQTWTWAEVAAEVRALACGLAALGLKPGDKIAIIGDNRPRLYWTMTAAQAIGAIPVPLYQDSVAAELVFVVSHAEIRFVMAEDQEQVDKMLSIMPECPSLERIIYDDGRGLRHYTQEFLHPVEKVQDLGREFDRANPDFFDAAVARGKGSDISIILYTSGTTGRPKGVVLSFDNLVRTAINGAELEGLTEREEVLAYLPMAWVGDHLFSYGQSYVVGFCVSCPESSDTVLHDLRELGPTYFFAPPRIFENILTSVMIRMEDAGAIKRRMFHYFMRVARRCGTRILDGKPVSLGERLLYALGNVLVYGPLRNVLGFSRIRLAYTAGEAIGPDIFDFYRSIGVNLKQLYGSTEASVFITIQPDGEIYPDTVGRPAPEVEIRIADNGEVMFRSPGVFVEYFKDPEATAATKTPDGWVHTGDAGIFADNGHLKIIDRAKDVGRLNDGSLFAPKYIENKLKFFPEIKEAVAFGHQRDYCAAFINIDMEAVGNWAERNNVAYASYQELAAHPEVLRIIKGHVEQVNRDLAADPNLAASQIRRFIVLHKELDADDGELTRTRKVRRRFIAERYGDLIEALYSGVTRTHARTEVTFEDGRKGVIEADLEVIEAETFGRSEPLKRTG
ncbi:MAG: long-chain fatty acid--CoA ligase [Alphaproteobacteria bacterium]|nr:MAG: long-chain fatty acid--CoA ligase [Alphaproteobacteria bacterium]